MKVDQFSICRLCLKTCKLDVKAIENTSSGILHLLNLNLGISSQPVTCNSCLDNLLQCINFKEVYLNRGIKKEEKLDVPKSYRDDQLDVVDTGAAVHISYECYFCLEQVNPDLFIFLRDDVEVGRILEKYFPEVVLNITKNSIMCIPCYETLQHHTTFINNCLDIEEKIQGYCTIEGTNSKGHVDLTKVSQFVSKNALLAEISAAKLEQDCYKQEEIDDAEVELKDENSVDVEEHQLDSKREHDIVKVESDDYDRLQDNSHDPQQSLENPATDINNMAEHQTDAKSQKTMHHCSDCTFKSKFQPSLSRHKMAHKNTSEVNLYKCNLCTYQAKVKGYLKTHMLTHKSFSEVTVFKCTTCTYESKYKSALKKHMLTHKSTSELIMYKCAFCNYQAKHKNYLQMHLITHKDASEVNLHKCNVCSFKTKLRRSLMRHMLIHKSASEVTMYKCEICMYQTVHKLNLTKHQLTHQNDAEPGMYECTVCKYKSKRKGSLSRHMVTHKDSANVTVFKCDFCVYQSIFKSNFLKHMQSHESSS